MPQVIVIMQAVIECDTARDAMDIVDNWGEGDVLSLVAGSTEVVSLEVVEGS